MRAADYTRLFDVLPQAVVVLGPKDRILYTNREGAKLLEAGLVESVKPLIPTLPPQKSKHFPVSGVITVPAGQARVWGSGYSQNGEVDSAWLIIVDEASRRDEAEPQAFNQKVELFEEILKSSFDELMAIDGNGVVLYANPAFETHYGIPVSEIIGRNVAELEKDGTWRPSVTPLVIKSRSRVTIRQQTAIGKEMVVTGTPILDRDGQVKMVVCNARDVTEISKLKSELEITKDLVRIYKEKLNREREDGFIVARSAKMQKLMDMAAKVSRSDVTVLLRGESGVGKDVLARAIHRMSSRREKLFLKVSCGALPDNLMEAELFGYRPGAFTGAQRQGKAGLMEIAQGGTIFFDEIGELPMGAQAKLLQVLDEKQFIKLGDTRPTSVDVRILAATNRDLEAMISQGTFRRDLFHRLNAVTLHLPALRERDGDIVLLCHHYLDGLNRKYQARKSFSPRAMKALLGHQWPGNIRELANLVEQLVITVDHDVIDLRDLPESMAGGRGENHPLSGLSGATGLESALEALEAKLVREAFEQHGSTYQVAKALGISQSAAYRKCKKFLGAGFTSSSTPAP